MSKELEFSGKIAVITGGSSGIGNAVATMLSTKGCNLALISRNKNNLAKVAKELSNQSVIVKIYPCDVSLSQEVKSTFSQIKKDFQKVDFLVNCAGYSSGLNIENIVEKELNSEININLKGSMFCAKYAYPLMTKGSSIVNVSSVRGRKSTPSSIGYAASKAAVINLTQSLARQLAKNKIRVNAVAPGAIYPTGMSQNWNESKKHEIAEKNISKRIGSPQEVANVIYFLLSDLSSYVNGHTIDINGGDWMN